MTDLNPQKKYEFGSLVVVLSTTNENNLRFRLWYPNTYFHNTECPTNCPKARMWLRNLLKDIKEVEHIGWSQRDSPPPVPVDPEYYFDIFYGIS